MLPSPNRVVHPALRRFVRIPRSGDAASGPQALELGAETALQLPLEPIVDAQDPAAHLGDAPLLPLDLAAQSRWLVVFSTCVRRHRLIRISRCCFEKSSEKGEVLSW